MLWDLHIYNISAGSFAAIASKHKLSAMCHECDRSSGNELVMAYGSLVIVSWIVWSAGIRNEDLDI